MRITALICSFGLLAGLLTGCGNGTSGADTTNAPSSKPAASSAPAGDVALIKTTEGDMVIQFWTDAAPKTIENFKTLARKGFYDGTAFHRVIPGFMIQGGDPNTTNLASEELYGRGGPGYTIPDEFNSHNHERGVISMASTGTPNSAGSQFFICQGSADSPNLQNLNGKYTTFGKLIKGDDVLEKIATTPTHGPDVPNKRMGIISIKIVPADSIK